MLFEDVEGALFPRDVLEKARVSGESIHFRGEAAAQRRPVRENVYCPRFSAASTSGWTRLPAPTGVLRSVDAGLPVRLVSASRGKAARAEPVAAQFETGGAKLAGRSPELEDKLAGLTYGGGYEGPGNSPDRADAMVWAMSELARPERPTPRVTRL